MRTTDQGAVSLTGRVYRSLWREIALWHMLDPKYRVAFVMRHVHHYREPFYRGVRARLLAAGIEFDLIHGEPSKSEQSKNDSTNPDWAVLKSNHVLSIGKTDLIYQPVFRASAAYDLVIIEQASRLLVNPLLLARRRMGRGPKIAMIGHGANMAASPSKTGEAAKRLLTTTADWFFAYTERTRQRLVDTGFPDDRITVFQNTLDMTGLRSQLSSITQDEIEVFRRSFRIDYKTVVLVLGSLYDDKRPDLIVPTIEEMRSRGHDIGVLVVGSGPAEQLMKQQSESRPWLTLSGPLFGRDKASALAASNVVLVPGVAGLVVLDAFAAGLPLVTARSVNHPPEIDYLENGTNGLIVECASPIDYADAIEQLLNFPQMAERLGEAALASGAELTIERMCRLFCDGVVEALNS